MDPTSPKHRGASAGAPALAQRAAPRATESCRADRATLSIRLVRATVETADRLGIAPAHFLRLGQFDAARLEAEEGRITPAEFSRLCELLLELSGDPALGMHEGLRMTGASFNIVASLVVHAATLRQGFESLFQIHALLNGQLRYRLSAQGPRATLCCAAFEGVSAAVHRYMAEVEMTAFSRMLRFFVAGARPELVCFAHAAPSYRQEYARIFEGRERFEQACTGLVFDSALLDAPSVFKDKALHDTLRVQAAQRIARIARNTPYADRVSNFLAHNAQGRPDMHAAARALGLSIRSLRRRLSAEGTSYQAVADGALAEVAKQHLLVGQRTIQETAFALGYADSGAFHRAFKRWTGTTPKAFLGHSTRL
jgi:AraC-like DNA-binding protein